MANIDLIIKIPEEIRLALINNIQLSQDQQSICDSYIKQAIIKGILLPKGHGRLIDADELTKEIKSYIGDISNLHYDDLAEAEDYNSAYCNCLDEIEDAPTIIEADKESDD